MCIKMLFECFQCKTKQTSGGQQQQQHQQQKVSAKNGQ